MRTARVPMPAPRPTLAARIAALEAELRALRRQQADALVLAIASVIGLDIAFSTRSLWRHRRVSPELHDAVRALGIRNTRQLGARLHQRQDCDVDGLVLVRVGRDVDGVIWALTVRDDCHRDAGAATPCGA